jgi:hypothetical protein
MGAVMRSDGQKTGTSFHGKIIKGRGFYSGLVIPGRSILQAHSVNVPDSWPEVLHRGSLNVHVTRWPNGFAPPTNGRDGAFQLDDDVVAPAFIIPGDLIENNRLVWDERLQRAREADLDVPGPRCPARVWRADLQVPDHELTLECWVLRRRGSRAGAGWELEVVSDEGIRDIYGLPDSEEYLASLTLFSGS